MPYPSSMVFYAKKCKGLAPLLNFNFVLFSCTYAKDNIVSFLNIILISKMNEVWKNASEEMYKAQAEGQQGGAGQTNPQAEAPQGDQVQDVDFEEVK